jgi:hypothetical protein
MKIEAGPRRHALSGKGWERARFSCKLWLGGRLGPHIPDAKASAPLDSRRPERLLHFGQRRAVKLSFWPPQRGGSKRSRFLGQAHAVACLRTKEFKPMIKR